MKVPAASAHGLTKQFGATHALDGVDFDVQAAEVHALIGENGAGKSTLVRLLSGVHRPDRGEIAVDGEIRRFNGPRDAIAAGVITSRLAIRRCAVSPVSTSLTVRACAKWRAMSWRSSILRLIPTSASIV
jgi:ABC-type sugar transport system ATPase subunit